MQNQVPENKNSFQPILVSRQKVGKYFDGLSPKTLANWKSRGIGPRPYNVGGRHVFYRVDELQAYLEGRGYAKFNPSK